MNTENSKLGSVSAGFVISAGITILFSTALAWTKDAWKPLNDFMDSVAWHNWITHGIVDVILFVALGLIFSRAGQVERCPSNRLVSFLVAAVLLAGTGLFVWYALF